MYDAALESRHDARYLKNTIFAKSKRTISVITSDPLFKQQSIPINLQTAMKRVTKGLALMPLLWLLLLPQVVAAQALPTTLVVKTTESKELCYDLTKISKITFTSGAIKIERNDADQHFTPETVKMSDINKLFFAKDRQENTTHITSPQLAQTATLSYYKVGWELHIEGFTTSDETLYIYTTEGQLLAQYPVTSATCILNATIWPSGLYIATTNVHNTLKITL